MKCTLIFYFVLFSAFWCRSQVMIEDQTLFASDALPYDYFGSALDIDSNLAVVGSPYTDDNGAESGSFYVFENNGNSWNEIIKIIASDGAPDDRFASSVAINGNKIVVGAPLDDNVNGLDAGSVYIYEFDGIAWNETKIVASDGMEEDLFGTSVSIFEDRIVVGAKFHDLGGDNIGAAYVYWFDGLVWTEQAKLEASDISGNDDAFGTSVSIYQDQIIVGVPDDGNSNGSNAGAIYFYTYDSDSLVWDESKKIATDGNQNDHFGYDVAIDNGVAVVGAVKADDNGSSSGAAYIFRWDGTDWMEESKLLSSDGSEDDFFGWSVDISNNKVVVGANFDYYYADYSGTAYLFEFTAGSWEEITKLVPSTGIYADFFGQAVALDYETILIGKHSEDGFSSGEGAGYIFQEPDGVIGFVYLDSNQNCYKETNEQNVNGVDLVINPGNILLSTDVNGRWYLDSLSPGIYSVTLDTSGVWNTACAVSQSFVVIDTNSLVFAPSFGVFWPCFNPQFPESAFSHYFSSSQIILVDSSSSDVISWYWTLDGDSLSNQNTAQYLFTQNGTYEICLIASNECFSDTICKSIIISTIGIEENSSETNIKVYPNPSQSVFTIEMEISSGVYYEITDVTGKLICTGILIGKNTDIDFTNTESGIYFLKVSEQVIKLVKQ